MRNKLDDLDWKILDILKKDARTPYVSIASTFNVSEGMIRQRIKKLIDFSIFGNPQQVFIDPPSIFVSISILINDKVLSNSKAFGFNEKISSTICI